MDPRPVWTSTKILDPTGIRSPGSLLVPIRKGNTRLCLDKAVTKDKIMRRFGKGAGCASILKSKNGMVYTQPISNWNQMTQGVCSLRVPVDEYSASLRNVWAQCQCGGTVPAFETSGHSVSVAVVPASETSGQCQCGGTVPAFETSGHSVSVAVVPASETIGQCQCGGYAHSL